MGTVTQMRKSDSLYATQPPRRIDRRPLPLRHNWTLLLLAAVAVVDVAVILTIVWQLARYGTH